MCEKKIYSKIEAQSQLNVNNTRYKRFKDKHKMQIRMYFCENCNGWHLTSKTQEEYEEQSKWNGRKEIDSLFKKKWNHLLNNVFPYLKQTND